MNNSFDTEDDYLEALLDIIESGYEQKDRTGVGTKTVPGLFFKFDIRDGKIPLWNTRKINHRNQWVELIWFLTGRTNVQWLQDRDVKIWDSWIKEDGTIGPGYGKQWTNFQSVVKPPPPKKIDLFDKDGNLRSYMYESEQPINLSSPPIFPLRESQVAVSTNQFHKVVESIKTNPASRRHIVTLWNPGEVEQCSLPPCHGTVIQFLVNDKRELHTLYYQRSADMVLGWCPWQYAMLANIIGKLTKTTPTTLSCTIGSGHIYLNQLGGLKTQLERKVEKGFPILEITRTLNSPEDIQKFSPLNSIVKDDYRLHAYEPQPFIKFPIAV